MQLRFIILPMLILCFLKIKAQDILQQKIDSKIEHVTVFLNGAQVARTSSASFPKGKSELILRGLTPNLDLQSITVKGDGDFTIMSVKPQMNFLEEQKRKDTIGSLENQRELLWDLMLKDSAEILVMQSEEDLLNRNRVQVLGIQQTATKTEDLTNLIDFQRKRLKEIYERKFQLKKITNQRWEEIRKIQAQIKELNTRKNTTTAEIVITVFAKNTSINNAKFQIEYIVPNTNWYPTYDIRVQNTQEPMLTQMKAKVRQNSGEDWREVKLTLSTGEPKRTGVKPELGVWFLGSYGYGSFWGQSMNLQEDLSKAKDALSKNTVQGIVRDEETGEPLIGASVIIQGTSKGTITDIDGRFAIDIPFNTTSPLSISYTGYENIMTPVKLGSFLELNLKGGSLLNEVVVTGYGVSKKADMTGAVSTITSQELSGRAAGVSVGSTSNIRIRGASSYYKNESLPLNIKEEQKPTTTSFDIELPYSIPTNGKEYQVDIKEVNLAATYKYACAPKLDNDAFLTAEVLDWEKYNLLEGEANLYLEGTYLGKSLLKTNSTDDTLKISLGRDKNVVIKRTKLKEFGKNKILSNKRQESRSFEIVLKNKKSYPLSIVIEEQIPISKDKRIDITHKAEGAQIDAEKGRLTWKVTLNPSEDKKLTFSYMVVYPESWNVNLE